MHVALCRHIKTNGLQCHGVAVAGSPFCYFHSRLHQRHAPYRFTAATKGYLIPGQHIELGPLEDRESIQLALSCVINALATGSLEIKRATALLYGLQLASANAVGLILEPDPGKAVRHVLATPGDSVTPSLDLAPHGQVHDINPGFHVEEDNQHCLTAKTQETGQVDTRESFGGTVKSAPNRSLGGSAEPAPNQPFGGSVESAPNQSFGGSAEPAPKQPFRGSVGFNPTNKTQQNGKGFSPGR